MLGIGYQAARKKRFSEGFNSINLEAAGYEEFILYFGRAHIEDFETGNVARGLLKIGRGKFKTAIMRGRNQPGVDFRIYAEIIVRNNDETRVIEKIAHTLYRDKSVKGSQGQRELFDIKDNDIINIVNKIADVAKKQNVSILSVNFY